MASTGTVQRYQLTGKDTISVQNAAGGLSELVIGEYHFQLPQDKTAMQQVAQQFQNINWNQLSSGSTDEFNR
jgi:hypothetical protein